MTRYFHLMDSYLSSYVIWGARVQQSRLLLKASCGCTVWQSSFCTLPSEHLIKCTLIHPWPLTYVFPLRPWNQERTPASPRCPPQSRALRSSRGTPSWSREPKLWGDGCEYDVTASALIIYLVTTGVRGYHNVTVVCLCSGLFWRSWFRLKKTTSKTWASWLR